MRLFHGLFHGLFVGISSKSKCSVALFYHRIVVWCWKDSQSHPGFPWIIINILLLVNIQRSKTLIQTFQSSILGRFCDGGYQTGNIGRTFRKLGIVENEGSMGSRLADCHNGVIVVKDALFCSQPLMNLPIRSDEWHGNQDKKKHRRFAKASLGGRRKRGKCHLRLDDSIRLDKFSYRIYISRSFEKYFRDSR